MQYIIRVVFLTPYGSTEGVHYSVAQNEQEMERLITIDFGNYNHVSCLGPAQPVPLWMENILNPKDEPIPF